MSCASIVVATTCVNSRKAGNDLEVNPSDVGLSEVVPITLHDDEGVTISDEASYVLPAAAQEWTNDLEKEFLNLLKKRAMGTMAGTEKNRYETLRLTGRQFRSTRSYDEMDQHRKTEKAYRQLVEALELYKEAVLNS